MQHIDIHDSLDKYKSVILVRRGHSRSGTKDFYMVLIPLPYDGALMYINISLYASKICSRDYNQTLNAISVRRDNGDGPEAIAASLGLHHFGDAGRVVANIF